MMFTVPIGIPATQRADRTPARKKLATMTI
jgi:hypothetical protein